MGASKALEMAPTQPAKGQRDYGGQDEQDQQNLHHSALRIRVFVEELPESERVEQQPLPHSRSMGTR